MKDVRLRFADEEYGALKSDADRLQISVRQLVHDRAINRNTADSPLHGAKVLSAEISRIRSCMNQIIRREQNAEIRLYEDDVIQLERRITELEQVVSRYIVGILKKEAQLNGKSAL